MRGGLERSRHRGPVSGEEADHRPAAGAPGATQDDAESLQCLELCGCSETRREPLSSSSQSQHRNVATWSFIAASTSAGERRRNEYQNNTGSWRLFRHIFEL